MKENLRMLAFVLVLGAVLTSALVAVDRATDSRVKANTRRKVYAGVLKAHGIDFDRKNVLELEAIFSNEVNLVQAGTNYYLSKESGHLCSGDPILILYP